jgi:outer membrane beta-barrel protein
MAYASDEFVIPEDELMREVVLPRFDKRETVKRSNVTFDKRFEVGIFGGSNFTEPVYNPYKFGLELGYHWSDVHSVHFSLNNWMSGFNNQYVPSISAQGGSGNAKYDFDRVPVPRMSYWGYYNLKAYYGKISFSKKDTMNLSLYTQYGAGITQFSHKAYPGLAVGVGQKFYLNNNLGFKAEIRLQYQGQPNPFLGGNQLKGNQPKPDFSAFSDIMRFGTIFEVGALWMF